MPSLPHTMTWPGQCDRTQLSCRDPQRVLCGEQELKGGPLASQSISSGKLSRITKVLPLYPPLVFLFPKKLLHNQCGFPRSRFWAV